MTKNQLHNLIYFCANFHRMHDCKIEDQNAEYILEKWTKYIGISPKKNENLPTANHIISNYQIYNYHLYMWVKRWGKDYDKVKEILNFILIINTKHFINSEDTWICSELIETFKEQIGDPREINKDEYKFLHELIMKRLHEVWLESDMVYRDYKLCLVVE